MFKFTIYPKDKNIPYKDIVCNYLEDAEQWAEILKNCPLVTFQVNPYKPGDYVEGPITKGTLYIPRD